MNPKNTDEMANSVDPDQTSDLGLHCLPSDLPFPKADTLPLELPGLVWEYVDRTVHAFDKKSVTTKYRNGPTFLDRQVLANSADPDPTAPQGLHCLPFCLLLYDAFLYSKASLFKF